MQIVDATKNAVLVKRGDGLMVQAPMKTYMNWINFQHAGLLLMHAACAASFKNNDDRVEQLIEKANYYIFKITDGRKFKLTPKGYMAAVSGKTVHNRKYLDEIKIEILRGQATEALSDINSLSNLIGITETPVPFQPYNGNNYGTVEEA